MLAELLNPLYRFHSLNADSPTHYQLIRCMQSAGLRYTPWQWRSRFTERNLNLSSVVCECLEFKHHLVQLCQRYCPHVIPESYVIDDLSWSMVLSEMADLHYRSEHTLLDQVDDLAWILKPALLNNGQHIKIFDKLSQIEEHFLHPKHVGGPHVLQRYIVDPDLYEGCKYSLRFFVVITQESGAFLYRHGYLNVALLQYPRHDYTNLSAHLTNEHLNHHTASVVQIPTSEVSQSAQWYPKIKRIVHEVTHGLEQAFPKAFIDQKERSFAVFGFDFLIDEMQRPWLLEVNHGPCFPTNETHPLQEKLYHHFWDTICEQFVLPITKKQSIALKNHPDLDPMRG